MTYTGLGAEREVRLARILDLVAEEGPFVRRYDGRRGGRGGWTSGADVARIELLDVLVHVLGEGEQDSPLGCCEGAARHLL